MKYQNLSKLYDEISQIKALLSYHNAEFLDIDQAAEYLKLKKSYLYSLIHQNKIPFYKPNGKKVYFNKAELNKWICSSKVKTADEVEQDYLRSLPLLTSKKQVG